MLIAASMVLLTTRVFLELSVSSIAEALELLAGIWCWLRL